MSLYKDVLHLVVVLVLLLLLYLTRKSFEFSQTTLQALESFSVFFRCYWNYCYEYFFIYFLFSVARSAEIEKHVLEFLSFLPIKYGETFTEFHDNEYLTTHVAYITVCDTEESSVINYVSGQVKSLKLYMSL